MDWLNYHHLLYFWMVAKEGSIAAAARRLHLAQPTISTQIKTLESQVGTALFERAGRGLKLTESGRVAFRYADEIFGLGREMLDALKDRPTGRPMRLTVGLALVVPKLVAHRLLAPALGLGAGVHVEVYEDKLDRLLASLATHELDLVLSDTPLTGDVSVRAFNHPLGESPVTFFAAPPMAPALRKGFPGSLDRAPFLAPMPGSTVRKELDRWFDDQGIAPEIVGQFDDSALLKVFGQAGVGAFAAPTVIEKEVRRQYQAQVIGRVDAIVERFYAISVERRLKHAGVVAITEAARNELFV